MRDAGARDWEGSRFFFLLGVDCGRDRIRRSSQNLLTRQPLSPPLSALNDGASWRRTLRSRATTLAVELLRSQYEADSSGERRTMHAPETHISGAWPLYLLVNGHGVASGYSAECAAGRERTSIKAWKGARASADRRVRSDAKERQAWATFPSIET